MREPKMVLGLLGAFLVGFVASQMSERPGREERITVARRPDPTRKRTPVAFGRCEAVRRGGAGDPAWPFLNE
jgi:hypothetical protein